MSTAGHTGWSRAGRLLRVWLCLGLLPTGAAWATGERPEGMPYLEPRAIPQLSPSYRLDRQQVVVITDRVLHPRRLRLRRGEHVAWISRSRAPSSIVFERNVAGSMECRQLVNFHLRDDELRSGSLGPGDFATFCQLAPGRYRYSVKRDLSPYESVGPVALEGEILVE